MMKGTKLRRICDLVPFLCSKCIEQKKFCINHPGQVCNEAFNLNAISSIRLKEETIR